MKENKEKLKAFLARFIREYELKDDEDIFETGFVNSLFSMQLIMFLEKEFDITIDNENIEIDNFRTINSILSLVEKLQNKN
ncbi:MAG: acyl carrier protein [Clostridium sp.]